MSIVERKMAELATDPAANSEVHEKTNAVRIPVRYVKEWSVRADSKHGGHVELVLDGLPINALVVLVNELKAT